jgi:Ca-activated chloride channel family protein
MRRRFVGLILVALATAVLAAAQEPYTLKVNTSLVQVEAIVADSNGHAVVDLTKDDFEVYEDGAPQDIRYFASAETPRSILLLFDRSGSASNDRDTRLIFNSAITFLRTLRPQDRVSIYGFARDFKLMLDWRPLNNGKKVDVQMMPTQIGSDIYLNIQRGLQSFGKEKGRKGIIVMTDGRDTDMFNQTNKNQQIPKLAKDKVFLDFLKVFRKEGVPIYFVALNTDRNLDLQFDYEYTDLEKRLTRKFAMEYLAEVRERMEKISEVSGGFVTLPKTMEDTVPMFDRIGQELGVSYSLGYAPSNTLPDGKLRKIEVRMKKQGLKLTQSRDGYEAASK